MIELKDIGDRLVSIVSVEHYALGLLKMLEDKSQKEVAQYIGVSQSKLSPIVQLLAEIHINKPCMIVRYIKHIGMNSYYLIVGTEALETNDSFIDIFKFDMETVHKVFEDLSIDTEYIADTYYKIDKLPQITIDALHNLEYKHKA